jgi:hypothetical protein
MPIQGMAWYLVALTTCTSVKNEKEETDSNGSVLHRVDFFLSATAQSGHGKAVVISILRGGGNIMHDGSTVEQRYGDAALPSGDLLYVSF